MYCNNNKIAPLFICSYRKITHLKGQAQEICTSVFLLANHILGLMHYLNIFKIEIWLAAILNTVIKSRVTIFCCFIQRRNLEIASISSNPKPNSKIFYIVYQGAEQSYFMKIKPQETKNLVTCTFNIAYFTYCRSTDKINLHAAHTKFNFRRKQNMFFSWF